jgi:shikimate dehydrogenase
MAAAPEIVDGATRLFGIIGDPIDQVRSPQQITARFRAAGKNAICLPIQAHVEGFDAVMRGLKAMPNFDGTVLTVPHKVRAMDYVDRLSPDAERIGAVNVMRREPDGAWYGDMTDGKGLLRAAREAGFEPKGKRAIVFGAGGAGSAIIDALADAGAREITIVDVDSARARAIASRLGNAHSGCRFTVGGADVRGQDILVNASPIGMHPGTEMPAPFGRLDATLMVSDVITKPEITPLLAHARACGCTISTGVAMYQAQADLLAQFLIPEIAR